MKTLLGAMLIISFLSVVVQVHHVFFGYIKYIPLMISIVWFVASYVMVMRLI